MRHRTSERTVLVAGATGRLGSIVDLLVARGHRVRAMTRDPESPGAKALRAAGAAPVYGDFDEPRSIAAAAHGATAVFATGTAHRSGPEGELRHGANLVAAVKAARVPHLVYVSGDGAAPDSPLPLFRAKFEVEERIRTASVSHTILAPVYFMENLFNPWNLQALGSGSFPSPVPVDQPLQQVALADLVELAASVIASPGQYLGQRIRVASDELSAEESALAIGRVTGRLLPTEQLDVDELPPGLRALFGWLEHVGHNVDVAGVRGAHPEVGWRSYEAWATSQQARFRELCQHPVGLRGR
jgi:uncharacterized protein YbjT (DUF2867 family)